MKIVEKLNNRPIVPKRRMRVAAYARVSMESDRMAHSLSSQVSYYSNLIQHNPEWEYVGIYADNFISGTSIEKRPEFKRMLEDCENGKIDLILTKSISRFARNTLDLLNVVRRLKELRIEVRFERENICSLSGKGEFLLTILACMAQEESRSISENVKWGITKKFRQGLPPRKLSLYGYRWDGDHFVIEPEEAKVVRLIFEHYLAGFSAGQTMRCLEKMGVKVPKGARSRSARVGKILRNIHYTGNLLFQKEYTVDPLGKKRCVNDGALPRFLVKNTHEAIISMEMFRQVQDEMARRKKIGPRALPNINATCFTGMLKCANCGKSYHRCVTTKRNGPNGQSGRCSHFWLCGGKQHKGVGFCSSKNIAEKPLIKTCCEVLGVSEFDEELFLERVQSIEVCTDGTLIFHMKDGTEVEKNV